MKRTLSPKTTRKRTLIPSKGNTESFNKAWKDTTNGHFQKGNQFYMLHNNAGRPRDYKTPEELLAKCMDYFQWVEDNPLTEEKIVGQSYGEVITHTVNKMRPRNIHELAGHLNIAHTTWIQYRNRPEFSKVCTAVEDAIRAQKFIGAATGFFNHAIIARDLGLVDKKDVTSDNKPINPDHITHEVKLSTLANEDLEGLVTIFSKMGVKDIDA